MWLCWRAICCNEAYMYRWVSEGKPEEVRELEQPHFSLTSYVVMFLYHTTCRRAGVHVYTSQRVSPEVRSKEVLHLADHITSGKMNTSRRGEVPLYSALEKPLLPYYYHSIPYKLPWALTRDKNSIRLYRSCYSGPLKCSTCRSGYLLGTLSLQYVLPPTQPLSTY